MFSSYMFPFYRSPFYGSYGYGYPGIGPGYGYGGYPGYGGTNIIGSAIATNNLINTGSMLGVTQNASALVI